MSKLNNTEPIIGTKIDLKLLEKALSAKSVTLQDDYKRVITALLKVHELGMLHYSVATNSFELRIPDPILLHQDGIKELNSKHLYINITKYINDGHQACARCVKNGKIYQITELLNMTPLLQREDLGWDPELYLKKYKQKKLIIPKAITSADDSFQPEPPGECISILDLPEDHVAIQYLYSRGFTKDQLPGLYKQFRLSYCISTHNDFYADMYQGLSKSPVGKLIFFIYHNGILKGWQARRLEKREGDTIYHWHLDQVDKFKTGWIPVGKFDYLLNKVVPLPDVPKAVFNSKYVIGFGTRASSSLLGFDAAVAFNTGKPSRSIVLVEGALDAAKFGAPACSVFGCRLSKKQAERIVNDFENIFFIKDHDSAGEELETSIRQELMTYNPVEIVYDNSYKDIGEIKDPQIIKDLRLKYNID